MGAVPVAWFAKLNTSVCQPMLVVVSSVSTEMVGTPACSALRRTITPAAGENTFTEMLVAPEAKGIGLAKPVVGVMVVPAQVCAPLVFSVRKVLLVLSVGDGAKADELPPKSVKL